MSLSPIRKLSWNDKRAFISVMENAFSPDPFFQKLFNRNITALIAANQVKVFFSFIFDMSMLMRLDARGFFDGDRLVACYLLEVPSVNPFRKISGAILVLVRALVLAGKIRFTTLIILNDYMRLTRSNAPLGRHYYLMQIGVHEAARGQGIGKALMQEIIRCAEDDKKAIGICLDTENKANVGLYEHFGFIMTKEISLDGLPIYCMFRKKLAKEVVVAPCIK